MAMDDKLPSPDGLFGKWGEFQIGAYGKLAVLVAAGIISAYLGRSWGFW